MGQLPRALQVQCTSYAAAVSFSLSPSTCLGSFVYDATTIETPCSLLVDELCSGARRGSQGSRREGRRAPRLHPQGGHCTRACRQCSAQCLPHDGKKTLPLIESRTPTSRRDGRGGSL